MPLPKRHQYVIITEMIQQCFSQSIWQMPYPCMRRDVFLAKYCNGHIMPCLHKHHQCQQVCQSEDNKSAHDHCCYDSITKHRTSIIERTMSVIEIMVPATPPMKAASLASCITSTGAACVWTAERTRCTFLQAYHK
jgi:hypothetical protein